MGLVGGGGIVGGGGGGVCGICGGDGEGRDLDLDFFTLCFLVLISFFFCCVCVGSGVTPFACTDSPRLVTYLPYILLTLDSTSLSFSQGILLLEHCTDTQLEIIGGGSNFDLFICIFLFWQTHTEDVCLFTLRLSKSTIITPVRREQPRTRPVRLGVNDEARLSGITLAERSTALASGQTWSGRTGTE